jgi:serine/threonine protein kinase
VGASNVAGKLALVTEFAPLGSLASVMETHLVPYNMKLVILLEIARAIQFLHSNNIIHRDIKPLNVLVFSLEQKSTVHVKLTDFGTSKFVSDSTMTMTSNTGTIKYMAPETLGKKPRFDTSADLYSFALLMWEVITNESAFSSADYTWQTEIENFVLQGKRLPLPKELDPRLAQLITECWDQEPANRPLMTTVIQQLSSLVYDSNL